MDRHEQLLRDESDELRSLEERARSTRALYEHWERNHWSTLAIDYATDAASFAALDTESREGMIWIFAHRFHAEFNVATLLAPFLLAAPDYEMQLLLATQVSDEHRHLQSVLRVYAEVFGIEGGIDAVRALADRNVDLVATTLYDALERSVSRLSKNSGEDDFLRAVVVYHLIAEGVIARTAQNLAVGQYERYGEFPGLIEGQRLVARDEARHIGIGVSYARRRMADDREHAAAVIGEVMGEFAGLATSLLEAAIAGGMHAQVVAGYGVEPEGFYAEAMRLLQVRLRSIGMLERN